MPCTCPLHAYAPAPAPEGGPKSKLFADGPVRSRKLVFSSSKSYQGARAITVPCGQCLGCMLDRSREWAVRAVHEASQHEHNYFVTLTYDDEHLPADRSVSLRELQLFKKRLRAGQGPFRDLSCGEYGDQNFRPHYHSLIFGLEGGLSDLYPWSKSNSGEMLYRSATLEKYWTFGFAYIGHVTLQSAGYVARYSIKKSQGKHQPDRYRRTAIDPTTGEVREWHVAPEFLTMSKKPGLGAGWFEKYKADAFPSDFLVVDGKRVPVPRFYLNRLAEDDAFQALRVQAKRKRNGLKHADNNTDRRLLTRHESQQLRAKRLHRSHDAES